MPDTSDKLDIRVLVAEDDAEDRFLIERALNKTHRVAAMHAVADGQELVSYLDRCSPSSRPDLLILDLNMPKIDGREALHWLRHDPRYRALPVAVLTTSNSAEDQSRMAALGATWYCVKPEKAAEMVKMFSSMIHAAKPPAIG